METKEKKVYEAPEAEVVVFKPGLEMKDKIK